MLNKIDKVDAEGRAMLAALLPGALQISAKRPADVAALAERLIAHFEGELEDAELHVPWAEHRVVHAVHESCRVLTEDHDEHGTRLQVRAPAATLRRLRAALTAPRA